MSMLELPTLKSYFIQPASAKAASGAQGHVMQAESEDKDRRHNRATKPYTSSRPMPEETDRKIFKVGRHDVPADWPVKGEASKTFRERLENGFYNRFMGGDIVLDIGYKGYEGNRPIFPHAIGVDMDYPGYDGKTLPFEDESVDAVYTSHTLEHIDDYRSAIREWFRVLKVGGHIVCAVPHMCLYEKKMAPPSRWNGDHKRFYTPGRLMREFEESLELNTYRLRYLSDNDWGHDYTKGPEEHDNWGYEIELVIQKIPRPPWAMM